MDSQTVAYVDESMRYGAAPPVYLMAATTLLSDGQLERFEVILPKGARKLHWRDMTDPLKARSVRALSETDHLTTIVAAAPLDSRRQERARAKCLQALLPALEDAGVQLAVLEGRNRAKANARDLATLDHLRNAHAVRGIRIEHAGVEEHRLWLPDQILGAYGDVLCSGDRPIAWMEDWRRVLPNVEVIDVAM